MDRNSRPDPDTLLRKVRAEEQRNEGSSLKIFFGYAPGVGKTYTMLESAVRLKALGVDVVVGIVETHGRSETAALVEGLEVLPLREVIYRGTQLTEFDLDRALLRKPQVLLVDELAHSNAPGSRHKKRWQDVLELVEAGISVHATLNVQHIESLNDIVSQITYTRVRETVPDSILERANELELVDLPPDELLARMTNGKVYVPEQARRAVDNFFRRGNLLALRELALRRTAERIDTDVRAYRQDNKIQATWPAAERILVCIGPSPSSAKLIRGTRRIAAGLRAQWVAVYADAPDAYPMTPTDRERLQGHLRLAQSLGAQVARLSGSRVADEILGYAHAHNVTRIVIGKPTHSRWRDQFRGSLVNQLVRGSGDIEVHFISGGTVSPPLSSGRTQSSPKSHTGYWAGIVLVFVATAIGILTRNWLSQADFVVLFLLAIMLVALRFGRGPAVATAALSVAAYDFFLVLPYYTFTVEHARHLLTFAMMFAVGLVVSSLATRLRRQERESRLRETRTAALYSLSRELSTAQDESQAAEVTARHGAQVFGGKAIVVMPDDSTSFCAKGCSHAGFQLSEEELAVVRWTIEHGQPAGRGMDTLPGSRVTCLPIHVATHTLGAIAVETPSLEFLDVEHRAFLDAFVRQAALAIERARLTEDAKAAALRIRSEETRTALLSAVSHDLRTPLGAITGAGSALRDNLDRLREEERAELTDTICLEAERMERLISNILDMVRVESGDLSPKRDWVPLDDMLGSALSRLETRLGSRKVAIDLPAGLPPAWVDPVLFEQVLVNLFENVIKHCDSDTPIEVWASSNDTSLELVVADKGPGLPRGSEEQVFEKFYRGPAVRSGGVGLGLSICRGIVTSHAGTIRAENRREGGTLFRIVLPIAKPPAYPTETLEPERESEEQTL